MTQTERRTECAVIPDEWMSIALPVADASHRELAKLVRTCSYRAKTILHDMAKYAGMWSARRQKKIIRRALRCESFRIGMYRQALRDKRYEVGQSNAGIDFGETLTPLRHIIEVGHSLNVWSAPTREIVISEKYNTEGYGRPVWVFTAREHALHLMMSALWRAVSPCPPRQFGNSGGFPKLNKFLQEALPGVAQVGVTDFPQCFFSLVHDQVKAGCPLPGAAMERRLLALLSQTQQNAGRSAHKAIQTSDGDQPLGPQSPLGPDFPDDRIGRQEAPRYPCTNHAGVPQSYGMRPNWPASVEAFCEGAGVPPGSPLSVLVAEKVLDFVTRRVEKLLPGAMCVLWSDNLLLLLTNRTSIGVVKSALADAARSAIGDDHREELLRRLSLHDPRGGFRFCKRRYWLVGEALKITSDKHHFAKLESRLIIEQSEADRYSTELIVNAVLTHESFFNTREAKLAAGRTLYRLGNELHDPHDKGPVEAAREEIEFENASFAIHLATACNGEDLPGAWVALLASRGGTKEFSGALEFTDNRQLELRGLIVAMAAVPEGEYVNVYTRSPYLRSALVQLPRWKFDGFRRADGGRLANRSLWSHIADLSRTRSVRALPVPGKRLPKPLHVARTKARELLLESMQW